MISTGYRCPLYDGDADDTSEPLPGTTNSKIIPSRSANVTTPLRLFTAAGQLVTTGRRRILRLARHWPWASHIIAALERLAFLPNPG
jgi:hypothetical protein